jgi:hypothetical protein
MAITSVSRLGANVAEMLHVDGAEVVPVNRPVAGIDPAAAVTAESQIEAHIAHVADGRRGTRRGLACLCATDAASIPGEAVHPVRKPSALQFAVHQRAWRTDK